MRYADIIGQEDCVARLRAFTDFYRENGSITEHILLLGDEGMGEGTIAATVPTELAVPSDELDGAKLQIPADLTLVLTNLRPSQVLIVREIHEVRRGLQHILVEALKMQQFTITIGQGSQTRHHAMSLKPFTMVATAPKQSECSEALLRSFSLVLPLRPYSREALEKIAEKIAAEESLQTDSGARRLIAANARSCPHQVEMLMQRVARAVKKQVITGQDTLQAFAAFGMNVSVDAQTGGVANQEQMSGVEFERLIAVLLARMGFRTEMTKTTGDGGVDIVAVFDKPIFGGKYLFQCKRYAPENLVGASTVRDFYGAVTAERAVKGIFITTSDFTAQAREFAERVGLELINLSQLQTMLAEHGMGAL